MIRVHENLLELPKDIVCVALKVAKQSVTRSKAALYLLENVDRTHRVLQFAALRANDAVSRESAHYRQYFDKAPDKSLTLTVAANTLPLATVQFMNVDTAYFAPVEWVDGMPDMNWLSTARQVRWILRDDTTGQENMNIDWHVAQRSVMKIRIFNDPKSFHPMQHPIHLHGQRMLVIARDGVATKNLVWKDTALIPVGSTVDLLVDASNPGVWMLHCHIAEHLEAGMMMAIHVDSVGVAR